MTPTISWIAPARGDAPRIRILDQTELPQTERFRDLRTLEELCEAIGALRVRGAPAIGIAGAYGVALAAHQAAGKPDPEGALAAAVTRVRAVRPTAANLAWAADRVAERFRVARAQGAAPHVAAQAAAAEARALHEEDLAMSRAMGAAGAALLPRAARVLTHCNTGGLATGGLGTALAVLFAAAAAGGRPEVYVDETRPLLQGARLTVWELARAGIRATLIVDGAAAWVMATRRIDAVLVGADRIAANGDSANKIGTYSLAIAAAHHGVPFYVVAPSSTIDPAAPDGRAIPVEERSAAEVRRCREAIVAPPECEVWNPAFDVTPAALIRGWITERGLEQPPLRGSAA